MKSLVILIIGAGKLGRESTRQLIDAGHNVTLVEKDHEAAKNATAIFGNCVIQGDGCDPKVLERAGIARAQVVVTATGDDEDNLIVAELAHRVFGVTCVLARVNRPENQWLFTPQRGVDFAFCPVLIVTELIRHEIDSKMTKSGS
jgi:trk system potassium uptake protein